MMMAERSTLVLLLTAFLFCGPAAEVVDTIFIARGWKGTETVLPCHFRGEPEALSWVKESISQQQRRTAKAGFIDGNFESWEERFDIDKNFSLVINESKVADEGLYLCQVVLKNFETFENSIHLTISSMVSKHTIEECVDTSQSHFVTPSWSRQSQCTYETPSNTPFFNLTCVVSGFKPNITMSWSIKESGERLNPVVSRQTTLSDDTYERIETINVSAKHGTEQTFMCTAIGDSLKGTSTREIIFLPLPGSNDNVGLIIGLVIGVPSALTILLCLVGKFLQKYHMTYLPKKGCGWNPCWRRPDKPKPTDGEEDIMLTRKPSFTEGLLIQQCKEDLKKYYRMSRSKVTVNPFSFMKHVNLDEIYTNLSLMEKGKRSKKAITYKNLMTNDENGYLSKHLLIQGEGGVGKSTLCAKIAWDWSKGRILQDLDMVIVIPLRDVTDNKSIGSIVDRHLSDSNAATPDQIDDFISTNPSKILLIFDGFDEFKCKIEEKSSNEVIRILGLKQYKSCKVIVTTTPWRSHEFTMASIAEDYCFISMEGFNKDNFSKYIRSYFRVGQKDALADSLLSFIEENEVIRSNMPPFPIYCAMLCLMWNNFNEGKRKEMQKLKSFSQLFREMISFLKRHYSLKGCGNVQTQKADELLEKADRAILHISEVALKGLLERNLSFREEEFKDCYDAMKTCCRIGILTLERNVINRERRGDVNIQSVVVSTVSFPHKLFQEYVAGVCIANDRDKYDQMKKILLSRYQEFRHLFYFASALKKELGPDIIHDLIDCSNRDELMDDDRDDYYDNSYSYDYDDYNFCTDVAFECQTEEAARAVGERWKKYELSQSTSEHTKSGVAFLVHHKQVRSLSFDRVKCGRVVSRDLAEGICSSGVLREVTIFYSQFHTDFYKIIGKKATICQIEKLSLVLDKWNEHFQLQSSIGGDLAQWVFSMPNLSYFCVTCPYLDGKFLSTAGASASSCQIEELKVFFDSWDDGSHDRSAMEGDLAQWVFTMPKLSTFSLTCPYLDDKFFYTAINSASSCKIRELKLIIGNWNAPIYASSVGEKMAQWLCTVPHLSIFSVDCYLLVKDDFFATAAKLAPSCKICNLSVVLRRRWTSESVASAENFAEFLCKMPYLHHANIKCENLPTAFFQKCASPTTSCRTEIIIINGKPLN